MIDQTDFHAKQIIFYFPLQGEKISFRNDNLVIWDCEEKIKFQVTCYRIFLVFVVGDTTLTTGILSRANRFGFSICLMNRNLKVYRFISARMEGNTVLRKKQYEYTDITIGQHIIWNKVSNQRKALMNIRKKDEWTKEAVQILDEHIKKLETEQFELTSLLGVEGSASRVYFSRMFDNAAWNGRRPRIKSDYINASLDIGYTILFNMVDGILNAFGFDEYNGVLHRFFYMRKSLVCDLVEPFRPIIDSATRKAINLKQIKAEDYDIRDKRWVLQWKKSSEYARYYLDALLKYKDEMFCYIRDYYRAFMKGKEAKEFPVLQYKG